MVTNGLATGIICRHIGRLFTPNIILVNPQGIRRGHRYYFPIRVGHERPGIQLASTDYPI
jgi:hypothetical protein